ncbi:Prophage antirepressor [Pseudomonas sp. LAMO17WK12:I6]|uniref:BRO-N domain-containing protein n=1 Tax=unclassified Pseudomonas TaxID=196821 RepID=UPI000BD57A11|nr:MULTISPECIES: BRO family protein [unclassified Pseudomonas]SNY42445.1 Prophage antirepressor [Pseudomonas sp. LAMO17WK12:I6]SNY43632.1 Prophage antirepressor [Pseudomonas sp. LAMO17WK12:I5]
MKKPQCGNTEASENEINFEEEIVMSNISTNVIPFNFGKQQVRTFLINDLPWFVATDVASALEYRIAGDMTRNLDEDEKGTQIVRTRGGDQEMLVINESGLYSAILRSRKAEAKHFKKWVTSEVLPAIRKYGNFTDYHGAMGDLVGAVIGTSGENVLDRVIDQKASPVPHSLQRSFKQTMKSRLRSRFNVHRTALIPAECLSDACNFVAAYALEGEWIGRPDTDGLFFSNQEVGHIYLLMSRHYWLQEDRSAILSSARTLDSRVLMRVFDQINEARSSFAALDARRSEIYSIYRANGCSPGGYAIVA